MTDEFLKMWAFARVGLGELAEVAAEAGTTPEVITAYLRDELDPPAALLSRLLVAFCARPGRLEPRRAKRTAPPPLQLELGDA